MLYPSMSDLLKKVNNRYMLVNLTAKRARDIADEAEENQIALSEKPVKMALNDIISGHVVLIEHSDEACEDPCSEDAAVCAEQDQTMPAEEADMTTASEESSSEAQQN